MDIKKIKMDTFIANLSGISEHFNEQEVKCETESSMTSTIQLVDDDKNMDMIIRFYRKDKKIFSYTEYKDNKRHGVANTFDEKGRLQKHSITKNGKLESSKTFSNGRLKEEKYYNVRGRLHGECKYHSGYGAKSLKDIPYMTKHYKNGITQKITMFRLDGTKEYEDVYSPDGWQCKRIKYDEWEREIKLMGYAKVKHDFYYRRY